MKIAVVTGARTHNSLGKLIVYALTGCDFICFAPDFDIRDKLACSDFAKKLSNDYDRIDVLVNCAGINRINFLPDVSEAEWDEVIDTNAKGIFLMTQALLPMLYGGTVLNIVSNASHMPMTSSLAYNASKAAALMMTKQMNRELIKTHNITVFSVSPNKLRGTGMSDDIDQRVMALRGWTKEQAQAYQVASLPAGEETDPKVLAEFIGFLLSTKERHKYLAGCDIPYGL